MVLHIFFIRHTETPIFSRIIVGTQFKNLKLPFVFKRYVWKFYHVYEILKGIPSPTLPDLKDIDLKHAIQQVRGFLFGHNRLLVSLQNM